MTTEMTITFPRADMLNSHLTAGGAVQVTTYAKSWLYKAKHAGMFFERGNPANLYVKRGRSSDCLTCAGGLAVGIRLFAAGSL